MVAITDYSVVQIGDLYFDFSKYLQDEGDLNPKKYLRKVKEIAKSGDPCIIFEGDDKVRPLFESDLSKGGGEHGVFLRRNSEGKLEIIAASETLSKVLFSED